MTACPEMDALLALRAGGDLAAEEGARLDEHLSSCEGCRAGLRAYEETLDLARLPPAEPWPGELAVSTFSAYRRARRRRVTGLTLGAGLAAAALAASVVLAPALLTLRALPAAARSPAVHAAADDAAFTAPASLAASTASSEAASETITVEDVVLAAFDEADAP